MAGLLIDLDGVIYQGGQALPGACEAVQWLVERDVPHLFVTNTTSRGRQDLVAKLADFGLQVDERRILTPPVAAAQWLRERGMSRVALFTPETTRAEFDEFELVKDESGGAVDAVIVGDLGEGWRFEVLNQAFRLLMRTPNPRLLALGMTRYWRAEDGLRLDTAPFVMALSHASGVAPDVLGKPASPFFAAALSLLGTPLEQTYMIGDDINTDVGGAQASGLKGILVRTGKFRADDLSGEVVPDAVIDSFADLPLWWREHVG